MQPPAELSKMELRRYQAQIALPYIGLDGQHKIKAARVLVIGAGGKGLACMQQLASAGVGYIGISDNSIVAESELIHQSLYGIVDLGKQKAIVAKEILARINHQGQFRVHNLFIQASNFTNLSAEYDFIIDATNDWENKQVIGKLSAESHKPLVHAWLDTGFFDLAVFNYQNGTSFEHTYPNGKPDAPKSDEKVGFALPSVLYSICGSMMANEAMRIILGLSSPLNGAIARYHAGSFTMDLLPIPG